MKTIKQLFFLSFVLWLASACDESLRIRGNGNITSEFRQALEFDQVTSSGNFDIHITKGDEYELTVNAESNLLPYIKTDFVGNKLSISVRGIHNLSNTLPMEIFLTTPNLSSIKQSGSGAITTGYFESNNFDLVISGSGYIETAVDCRNLEALISGSGKLKLLGEANMAKFTISGSGKIESYDFTLNECNANISGSGNMWVNAKDFIEARISGSGSVFYIGNPEVELHVSGSGSLINDN